MLCPACKVELRITERQNVEIDYCPQCRGVWLDRGELDKIIDRVTGEDAAHSRAAPHAPRHPDPNRGKPDDSKYGMPSPYPYKKKSLLRELFDFD